MMSRENEDYAELSEFETLDNKTSDLITKMKISLGEIKKELEK